MKETNVIREKSYAFALRMVRLYKYLVEERKEYLLAKQVFRSGTSIGANAEEGIGAQSRKDFLSKIAVSYKEARETHYWLRLLSDAGYLEKKLSESLLSDCDELMRILGSIIKTTKSRNS